MGRLSQFDTAALARLLARQDGVVSRGQVLACAMTEPAIRHRIRADGPWQTMLPGVYLVGQGASTTKQRVTAAYLYAGQAIAVTGPAALAWYSLPSVRSDEVDVLVPLECKRKDAQFARLHRTGVVPDCGRDGVLRYASPQRAVADTVRQLASFADIRAVVAGGVQRGKITVADLARELEIGPIQGSARSARGAGGGSRRRALGGGGRPACAGEARAAAGAHVQRPPVRRRTGCSPSPMRGGRKRAWPLRLTHASGTCRPRTGSARWPEMPG